MNNTCNWIHLSLKDVEELDVRGLLTGCYIVLPDGELRLITDNYSISSLRKLYKDGSEFYCSREKMETI